MVSVPSSVSDFLSEVGFPVVDPSSLNVLCSDALIDSLSDNCHFELPYGIIERRKVQLHKWKEEKSEGATSLNLIEAFLESNNRQAAKFIVKYHFDDTLCDASSNGCKKPVKGSGICYNLNIKLGTGCRGTVVYEGTFEKKLEVAVKRVNKGSISEREKDVLMKCDHRNIVKYYCIAADCEFHYIALERCLASLGDIYGKDKKLKLLRGLTVDKKEILEDSIRGLQYLHEKNIVHKDIKPANILLVQRLKSPSSNDVKAVICDFGLASEINDWDSSLTAELAGTNSWIAPEMFQRGKKKFSYRSDIFSMGCVIYFVLSDGKHPFGDNAHTNIIQYQCEMIDIDGEDWPAAKDLIMSMIDRDKSLRPHAVEVINHCFFWKREKTYSFFEKVNDFIESHSEEYQNELEVNAVDVIGTNWMEKMQEEDLLNEENYDTAKVKDLLRAFKEKKERLITSDSFIKSFPSLLIHTYKQMKKYNYYLKYIQKIIIDDSVRQAKKEEEWISEKEMLQLQVAELTEEKSKAEKQEKSITEENEKLKSKVAVNEVYITELLEEKTQAEEQKQIITEENEKLKAKVADSNVYIIELLEEKTQAEEQKQIITEENEKLKAKVADNEIYITELLEEKTQAEEEKQITTELKAAIADKESHIAKLMKEKTQLKERSLFQQEQSIKETNTIGLQFNYLIPSMDNLDCLSDVQVAEKKLFLVQGRKPQLMNWEQFGLRIGIEEDSLLSSEMVEVAMAALVGGQFKFPKNTVLVSAVYAISVSEPLLKPLRLEMQHCVDLRGRPGLSQYLKFAIAPVSTPSLPYRFSLVEGGEFSSNSWYGAINRRHFCLVCIVGKLCLEEQEEQEESEEEDEEEDDSSSDSSNDSSNKRRIEGGGGQEQQHQQQGGVQVKQQQPGEKQWQEVQEKDVIKYGECQNERKTQPMLNTTELESAGQPPGVTDAITYAGIVYYEEKGVEDVMKFTAAKKLNALLEYIEKKHPHAEIDQYVYFTYAPSYSYTELLFDTPQEKPSTGWTIEPRIKPCRLQCYEIDRFGQADTTLPASCLITVYGSPNAVPSLHYSVPLVGVADPVTLYIHRSLRTTPPLPPPTRMNHSKARNQKWLTYFIVITTFVAVVAITAGVNRPPRH